MTIVEQLKRDEGIRLKPYTDTVGKITIGVGRNLSDVGVSIDESDLLLSNDVAFASRMLETACPWAQGLDEARKGALLNMTFNMGIGSLMQFKKFLEFMQAGNYSEASQEMLNSKWAEQVPSRAHRLSVQIATGVEQ